MKRHNFLPLLVLSSMYCAENPKDHQEKITCSGGNRELIAAELTQTEYQFESCYDLAKNVACESVEAIEGVVFDDDSAELQLKDGSKIGLDFAGDYKISEIYEDQIDWGILPKHNPYCPTANGFLDEQQCLKLGVPVLFANGLTVTLKELEDHRCENIGEEGCKVGRMLLGLLEVEKQDKIISVPFGESIGVAANRLQIQDSVISINRAIYGEKNVIFLTMSENIENDAMPIIIHDSVPSCEQLVRDDPSHRARFKVSWTGNGGDQTFQAESFMPKNDGFGFGGWESALNTETQHCEQRSDLFEVETGFAGLRGDLICYDKKKQMSRSVRFSCTIDLLSEQ